MPNLQETGSNGSSFRQFTTQELENRLRSEALSSGDWAPDIALEILDELKNRTPAIDRNKINEAWALFCFMLNEE